jgi:hypothetical protein
MSSPNWGQGAEGAVGGAMAGSAFGPWGTVIGGGVGGLLGLFGSQDPNSQYRNQLAAMGNMPAPQMGPAAQGQNSWFRQNQARLIAQLEAQAQGRGPSLAAQQLQAGQDRAQRQGQAQAAASMGPNAALSQFQAANMAGQGAAQANQDAAMARIQEQYNAQNLLGMNINEARGSDEGMSQFNATARNQNAQGNLEAKLAAMGYNIEALRAAGMLPQPQSMLGDQLLAGGAGMGASLATMRGNNTPQGQ